MLNVMRNGFLLIIGISFVAMHLLLGIPDAPAEPLKELGSKPRLTASEFLVRESGYWTCELGRGPCVYWLNNEQVIFNGSKPGDTETVGDGRTVSRHAIYVWNLKDGTVTKYADAERAVLCYADGYISYSRREPPYIMSMAGPFGNESEISRRGEKERITLRGSEVTWLNPFTCKSYKQSDISSLPGTRVPLKNGHGFLYLGLRHSADERAKPVIFYPEGTTKGVELPIARWQVSSSNITATEFNNSYILTGDQIVNRSDRCVPKGFSRRAYRLRVTGTVETISLPPREELRCHVEVGGMREVRKGITVYVNTGKLESSRLYLISQGELTEVVRGWISSARVSPDGCRMALGVSSSDDPRKPPTAPFYRGHLKVIDFCAKGNR